MAGSAKGNAIDGLVNHWDQEGYIVVRQVYDSDRVTELLPICERILEQWRNENPEKAEPGGGPDAHVMRHLNHPGYLSSGSDDPSDILEAAADESVLQTVSEILNEQPLFRCTSLFFNPLETSRDGNWHRDSQFRSKDDEEEQELMRTRSHPATAVQLQIALEPSEDIEFVPRSHLRWDTPEEYHIRKADDQANNRSNNMPGAIRISLEPGDAVAFNPMGLHRGRYHTHRRRRTLMLTYTAASAPNFDYFSDQPWFMSDGYLRNLTPRAAEFYNSFISTYRKQWVQETQALGNWS